MAKDTSSGCFDVALSRRGNMPGDEALRVVEQHAYRLTGLFVSQNLSAERILCVFRDAANLQRRAVCNRAVAIRAAA